MNPIKKQKIAQLKAIVKEFSDVMKHNSIAGNYNERLCAKLQKEAISQKPDDKSGFYAYALTFEQYKIYEALKKQHNSEFKEHKEWVQLAPWIESVSFWTIKDKKGVFIYTGMDADKHILTLFHILYNRLRNKTRGHTHDDAKYITTHEKSWKAMLEGMDVQPELLEAGHVSQA